MYVQGIKCEGKLPYVMSGVMVCSKVCVRCYVNHLKRKNNSKTKN